MAEKAPDGVPNPDLRYTVTGVNSYYNPLFESIVAVCSFREDEGDGDFARRKQVYRVQYTGRDVTKGEAGARLMAATTALLRHCILGEKRDDCEETEDDPVANRTLPRESPEISFAVKLTREDVDVRYAGPEGMATFSDEQWRAFKQGLSDTVTAAGAKLPPVSVSCCVPYYATQVENPYCAVFYVGEAVGVLKMLQEHHAAIFTKFGGDPDMAIMVRSAISKFSRILSVATGYRDSRALHAGSRERDKDIMYMGLVRSQLIARVPDDCEAMRERVKRVERMVAERWGDLPRDERFPGLKV